MGRAHRSSAGKRLLFTVNILWSQGHMPVEKDLLWFITAFLGWRYPDAVVYWST